MENNFDASKALLERHNELDQAAIEVLAATRPQNIYRLELDLSKERERDFALRLGKAFKSVRMERAEDPKAIIYILPNTNAYEQDAFELGFKDAWTVSTMVADAFIYWPKQTGKITLVFFSDSQFSSGTNVSLTAGGLSVNEGSSVIGPTKITLAAGVPKIIAPQNLFRKTALLQNRTGAALFIGGNNSVSNEGISFEKDERMSYRNTAALWAYSPVGGDVYLLEQE